MAKVFGATSTTDQVLSGVNLHGKRILVTGVSAGLGVETARSLAAQGAHVIRQAHQPIHLPQQHQTPITAEVATFKIAFDFPPTKPW